MKKLNKKASTKTVASCIGCKCSASKSLCKQIGLGQSAALSANNKQNRF